MGPGHGIFSAGTQTALRTLVYLARHGGRQPTSGMAAALGLTADPVRKCCRTLAALGYVAAYRGAHGGTTLARAAATIMVADVVRHFEGQEEFWGPGARAECAPVLQACTGHYWRMLGVVTLADLVAGAAA